MTNELTTPTKITNEQYEKGFFAINRANGDHWFINSYDNIVLWVGNSMDGLTNVYSDYMSGELDGGEINGVDVVDESGNEVEIEAITLPTSSAYHPLDLEKLEQGIIAWI